MADTNMRVRFFADTKQFRKGVKQSNQAMQGMRRDGARSFRGLAGVVQGQTGAMSQSMDAIQGVIGNLGTAFKGAAASTGSLSRALKVLKLALTSTGIGALIVALGSVIAYFQGTAQGAYRLKTIMAAIGATIDVLKDRLIAIGKGLFDFFAGLGKGIKNIFTGNFKAINQNGLDMLKGLKNAFSGENFKGILKEIKEESRAAMRIQRQMNEIERRRIELMSEQAKAERDIEKIRAKARELEETDPEKALQMTKRAKNIEISMMKERRDLQRRYVKLLEEQQALGNNTIADNKELEDAKEKLYDLETKSFKMQRRLTREVLRYKRAVEDATAAWQIPEGTDLSLNREENSAESITPRTANLSIAPQVDMSGLEEMTRAQTKMAEFERATISLQQVISMSFQDIATSFAEMTGQLAVGATDLETFGKAIFETIADLAVRLGKLAIGIGTAALGIKKALELNPWLAIAAGAALIALGSAAKASMANMASSGGSSAQPTRTNRGISNRETQVQITGELTAQGRDLKLVLDRENNRRNIST